MIVISKYSNTIEYNLKTTLDSTGINKLQTELVNIQTTLKNIDLSSSLVDSNKISQSIAEIEKLKKAMTSSYNSKLGLVDMSKFTSELSASGTSITKLQSAFSQAGSAGTIAFNNVLGKLGTVNTGIKTTSSLMDKLGNTFGNTIRWGITSNIFNQWTNSLSEAVDYAKELDDSLTQIMLVTDYSRQDMIEYAKSANEAAKALAATTTDVTSSTLIFAQQGYDLEKSNTLAQLSTKLANASQQDTASTADQITAYMNAYGLDSNLDKLQSALDSWAEVANVSAADVAELAEASQRAASSASTLGVSTDQLNAQIATIESVTREAPEVIGNGLKTIFARFSDLQAGETLDDDVTLGTVTSTLSKIGVQVLDGDNKMRGVGAIMEDLMDVWSSIDTTQKAAVAQTLAGKYQMTRFMALMNRSDLYDEYKSSSENASGTLDTMNEKYVDSLEGRLTKLQATFEGLLNSFGDSSELYGFIDALTMALDVMNDLVDSIGGGGAALTSLGAIATKVFSKQIAGGISNLMQNLAVDKLNNQNQLAIPRLLEEAGQSLDSYGNDKYKGYVKEGTLSVLQSRAKYADEGLLNDKDAQAYSEAIENTVHAVNQLIAAETNVQEMVDKTNIAMQTATGITEEFLRINEQGQIERTQAYQDNIAAMFPNDADLHTEFLQVIQEDLNNTYKHVTTFQSSFATMLNKLAQGENVTRVSTKALRKEMLDLFNSMTGAGAKSFKDINKLASMTVEEGEESNQVLKDLAQAFSDVWNAMGKGESSLKSGTEQAEKFTQAANSLEDKLEGIRNLALASKDVDVPTQADIDAANTRQSGAKAAFEGQKNANQGLDARMDDKGQWQNVTKLTSAITELAFAWQSFQSLGSIWANTDLTAGEKIEQTVLNLAFVLPQLLSAVKTFRTADWGGAINELSSGLGTMFTAVKSGIASVFGLTSATEGLAAAEASAATGASAVVAALGPIAIALTAIVAVGNAAWGYINQQNEERVQAITEAADEAKTSVTSIKDAVTSFDELYQKYKDGSAASDELKSAAESVNNALGDQSLAAKSAAENWDAYASSLDAAAKKKLQSSASDLCGLVAV